MTNAAASEARNWYAPARSVGEPHRRCAVCRRTPDSSSGRFFHASTSGESNHPGETTLTVIPERARSRARALARPMSPALDALYAASPSRGSLAEHRSGEDQPPALTHDPSCGPGAEEGTREVDVEHRPPHLGLGVTRTRHDGRDPRVRDPDVEAPPFGDGAVGDGLVEVGVGDVAAEHQTRAGELLRDRFEVGLAARDRARPARPRRRTRAPTAVRDRDWLR